jgi:hypothetical protein
VLEGGKLSCYEIDDAGEVLTKMLR